MLTPFKLYSTNPTASLSHAVLAQKKIGRVWFRVVPLALVSCCTVSIFYWCMFVVFSGCGWKYKRDILQFSPCKWTWVAPREMDFNSAHANELELRPLTSYTVNVAHNHYASLTRASIHMLGPYLFHSSLFSKIPHFLWKSIHDSLTMHENHEIASED